MKKIYSVLFLLTTAIFFNACKKTVEDKIIPDIIEDKDNPKNPPKTQPLLLLAQHPGNGEGDPLPVSQNIEHIESMPFDGIFVTSHAGWKVMEGQALTWESINSEFAPLMGIFTKFKHNFIITYTDFPGDLWDDQVWNLTAENFALIAKKAKDLGFKGIVYDNEEYKTYWQSYHFDEQVKNTNYTYEEHIEQVRWRGQQIMEAIVLEFPDIEVIVYHGPYMAEPSVPEQVTMNQAGDPHNWQYFDLQGAFFVGLIQGKGPHSLLIDGGEVYQYRSNEDFAFSYEWRKRTIASETTDSYLIPTNLRSSWSENINISFGVYNLQWKSSYPMDSEIIENTLINAFENTDKYVWFYTEQDNWLEPNRMPVEWIQAVQNARNVR